MKFGLFGGAIAKGGEDSADSIGYQTFIDYVIEADRLGYYGIFIVEHHFSGIGQVSASLNLLSFLAGQTNDIRLGTGVMVLPWHNPVLLAEQAASLDLLSGGRLDFGIGKGYRDIEFKGFAIDKAEASDRYEESVAILKQCWIAKERFSIDTRNWHFDDIIVEPAPIQKPHPPLWVGAGRLESISKAAKDGFNVLLDQFGDFELTRQRIDNFKSGCVEAGRDYDPMHLALNRTIIVTESDAETEQAFAMRAESQKRIDQFGRLPGNEQPTSYADPASSPDDANIIGQPHEVIKKIERLKTLDVEYILLTTIGGVGALKKFAELVMPTFIDQADAAE